MPDNFEMLLGDNGSIITNPMEIEDKIVDFYKKLYEDSGVATTDDNNFLNLIDPITDDEDAGISAPLTMDDVKITLRPAQTRLRDLMVYLTRS